MKRKRSDSDVSLPKPLSLGRKFAADAFEQAAGLPRSARPSLPTFVPRLLQILTQYSILECLATHLFAKDLFSLASTSRLAHQAILHRPESKYNLLRKTSCDGTGVRIRQETHRKSIFFHEFGCQDNTRCGTQQESQDLESRPCVSCGVTTCQECRTHCVYQSHYQVAVEEDELPNFSGFVLLNKHEMAILSPEHLREAGSWNDSVNLPHHDQGFLDSPLDSSIFSSIELVDDIIDANLGNGELKGTNWSGSPHPTAVIRAFWEVTEARKRKLCHGCWEDSTPSINSHPIPCGCTLRSRFLDRWLCLRCYQREQTSIATSTVGLRMDETPTEDSQEQQACSCGRPIEKDPHVLCLWCMGEVGCRDAQDGAKSPATESAPSPGVEAESST